jgi:LysW-gamma-L-lysine carboxypeptidase
MNAITLLQQLITIPSISGDEAEAAAYLVACMSDLGLEAFIDDVGNAVGMRSFPDHNGEITREIMLLGHIDTVPGYIPVRIENGKLFGRGVVDAKGPLAAFVVAGAQIQLSPGTKIVVIGAVEEESATSKGARHVAQKYQPDCCIIGEPSGRDSITLGYKGRLLIDYERQQPMGHTAGRELGAAEVAVTWWNDLNKLIRDFNEDKHRLFDQLIPSLRAMHTDSNGLINSAFLKVGIRLPPNFDVETFITQVRELAPGAVLRFYAHDPAFQSTRRTPLARALTQEIRNEGMRPRYKLKTGTSDMNVVGPVWNCPIVAYGPGESTLDHAPNEHIILEEYEQAIRILQGALTAIALD